MATQLDYYGILQVHPRAEKEVIDAAYRKLAAKYHPDVSEVSDASERMKQINAAYEVLSDPVKRAAYDAARGVASSQDTPHVGAKSRHPTNCVASFSDSYWLNATCRHGAKIRACTSAGSSQTGGITRGHFSRCLAPFHSGETKGMSKGPGKV